MGDYPKYHDIVWPSIGKIKESWLHQELQFSDNPGEAIGLVQPLNGPCGVLSAIQASLIAYRMDREGTCPANKPFTKEEISATLAKMIKLCRSNENSMCKVVLWENKPGEGVKETTMSEDKVEEFVLTNLDSFLGVGGPILLVYSAVATRTPAQILDDIMFGGGEPPLIFGSNLLCTSELVSLLIRGVASGNVGAYAFGEKNNFEVGMKVGLLSRSELDTGVPVADILKTPKLPVWILHGGDHFTVLYNQKGAAVTSAEAPPHDLVHWNGLPPAGPRLATMHLSGNKVLVDSPGVQQESYFKPVPGEIEDIVQAKAEDKKEFPDDWNKWRYEVILAINDPSIKGPERPKEMEPPKIFEQGEVATFNSEQDMKTFFESEFKYYVNNGLDPTKAAAQSLRALKENVGKGGKWRCASCYRTRFQTMCFGENGEATDKCKFCKKTRSETGWSIWLSYSDLPEEWRAKMDIRYAPKLLALLRTKWPGCEISNISDLAEKGYPSV